MRAPVFMLLMGFLLPAQPARFRGKPSYPVDWVNPLMGTQSTYAFSQGNTYPAIALPWGMHFWSPQTGPMGNGWLYQYDSLQIRGFRQTHQPSPWINDYGPFSLMPITGPARFSEEERKSWFSHKTERARPYCYSVYLGDADAWVEVVPTERSAIFRITYPPDQEAHLVVDPCDGGSFIRVDADKRRVEGYSSKNSGGVPRGFRNTFVMTFDRPVTAVRTWSQGAWVSGTEAQGDHVGTVLRFDTRQERVVTVRVASSFIGSGQAWLNLEREQGGQSFEQLLEAARACWNRELGRIQVEGGTLDQKRTFYSCLYRVLLFPRKFHETNRAGEVVHYSPFNGKICPGYLYTDNGFWDTFRAVFPFLTVMYPDVDAQIMAGLANVIRESGWLPEWASPGHRNCMIGSHSASIIADAYLKGISIPDIDMLYQGILKNSEQEGPLESVGRAGVNAYNRLGYVPCDGGLNETAARTLEYAYDDYAISLLARALRRPSGEVKRFADRALNYRNLYDRQTGFMRGRRADGCFREPFDPFAWGGDFTEGNSWQFTWFVPHDVAGLCQLMGGRARFCEKLDGLFAAPPRFDASYYGKVIHEIREMQVAGFGNYAHGNQPIQHGAYLFACAGQPWKTQYWVHEVMERLYAATPDGYCGDEDNGQTSAWYVFSALGFYPVCPGQGAYVLGSPLFRRATMHLPGGGQMVIHAPGVEEGRIYIRSAQLNGRDWSSNVLWHRDLVQGGRLDLVMSAQPGYSRGTQPQDAPPSLSDPD